MKKILSVMAALLVIVSAFTFTASAEEPVNYSLTAQYTIDSAGSGAGSFLSNEDGTLYYGDDFCEILNDGVNPYYSELEGYADQEVPGYGIVLTGSSAIHTITFDLGEYYDDIDSIVFGNVWDSFNFGYAQAADGSGQGNRGFKDDKAIIRLSADGATYERTKDYNITKENHSPDGIENGFYNYIFKMNAPAAARYVQLVIYSPAYCLSLSEIEIYGYGHVGEAPETPVVSEEASEDIGEELSEATDEAPSEAASEAASEAVSEAASEATSETVSEAAASSSDDDKDGGSNVGLFIGIGAGVVVIAVVVVIILKKKK